MSTSPCPPSATGRYKAAALIQCLPDQKKSRIVLWTLSSIRPLGGVKTMSLCHRVEATKLLATRTLPLYDNWGSKHFHLDNGAHTFSLIPSQFFNLYPSVQQGEVLYSQYLQPLPPPFKSSRQTGHCLIPPLTQQQCFALCPVHPCRSCLLIQGVLQAPNIPLVGHKDIYIICISRKG